MARNPAFILAAAGALLLVVVVLAFVSGGGDGTSPLDPDQDGGDFDLASIPTATFPASTPETILVNDVITATPTPQGTVITPEQTYTILAGDTLGGVALQFGITLDELLAANPGIDPLGLHPGDVIVIPAQTETPSETPEDEGTPGPDGEETPDEEETGTPEGEETPNGEGDFIEYTVQPGDIASAIADQFGVTLEDLAAANNTTVDDLASLDVGEVLRIPQ